MAADDKSIACNTFLQLISGKKPNVTSIQFVKPERSVGFFLTVTEVERVSTKSCYNHLIKYEVKKKQEPPC